MNVAGNLSGQPCRYRGGRGSVRFGLNLIAGLVLGLLATLPAGAADTAPALSRSVYERLQASQELLGAGKTDEAIAQLRDLLADAKIQIYDRAVALQALGHAHLSKDRYRAAISHFKEALALNILPADVQQRLRYNLAQLYLVTEEYAQAVRELKQWFDREAAPKAEAYVLLGSAYLQLERYRDAVRPLQMAIDASAEPKEGWYQSLLAAYYELKDYGECAQLLQTMLRRFPDRASYWQQLAGIQLARERYRDALAVMELAYARGQLEQERDLLQFAQLYSFLNAPYKGGLLLEQEIQRGRVGASAKHWELAGNAWAQAKETDKAIAALEKARAMSQDPKLGLRVAQLYLDAKRWDDASRTLRSTLNGRKLDRESAGRAWMLLGIARYENELLKDAHAAFAEAAKYRKTHDDAQQWLAFLEQAR